MGDAGFFKGTSADQDARFSNKHRKLLKSMTFPASFKKKVDITKVNVDLMQPWIAQRIKDLLGIDDEVVTEFVFDKTPQFVTELWDMLLSAQENVGGIPTQLIEQKKKEIMEKRVR
ncbi:serine/arginine repetitive matrix 1-like protein [Syncephalis fuscata]|nr:serine/arginine repetitive matrix 1-like protein [Syncephalis fuscata]